MLFRSRTNTYNITFRGSAIGFTNALWTGAEIINKKMEDDIHTYTLKALQNVTANQILQAAIPYCEVISFNEIIPSMNDIFINKVEAEKEPKK